MQIPSDLAQFEAFIADKSYVEGGAEVSAADMQHLSKIGSVPCETKFPNAFRWFRHVSAVNAAKPLKFMESSASSADRRSFGTLETGVQAPTTYYADRRASTNHLLCSIAGEFASRER